MREFKYYLNGIDIAFGIISFSYNILTTISIFSLSLSFGIFVYNTNKTFPFSRFRKIAEVLVNIFAFSFFVYLFSWMLFLSGDTVTIGAKSVIWTITLPSIIETGTASLPIILLKYNFQKHIWQYKDLISNASLEHTWTLVSLFMMKSFIYPAKLLPGVIVQLKVNVEVYVYIVKIVYHERSLISIFFMNT